MFTSSFGSGSDLDPDQMKSCGSGSITLIFRTAEALGPLMIILHGHTAMNLISWLYLDSRCNSTDISFLTSSLAPINKNKINTTELPLTLY
jgi:hypothetical protein